MSDLDYTFRLTVMINDAKDEIELNNHRYGKDALMSLTTANIMLEKDIDVLTRAIANEDALERVEAELVVILDQHELATDRTTMTVVRIAERIRSAIKGGE